MSKHWSTLTAAEKAHSSRCMEVYAGMVARMDYQIGRILSYLRETDKLDNTLVLFMSDNGAEGLWHEAAPVIRGNIYDYVDRYYDNSISNIGRYNSYVWYGPHWASAATAPSRLYKAFSSEGGIRVPFVMRYPPLTARQPRHNDSAEQNTTDGRIEHAFATVMDLMPTFLDLAGVSHPAAGRDFSAPGKRKGSYKGREVMPMRGVSWVPYLSSTRDNHTITDATSTARNIHADDATHGWELFGRMGVRKGKYKAVFIPEPYGPERWQLYDLERDPGETDDLAEMPEVASGKQRTQDEVDAAREKLKELVDAYMEYVIEVGVQGRAPGYGTLVVE